MPRLMPNGQTSGFRQRANGKRPPPGVREQRRSIGIHGVTPQISADRTLNPPILRILGNSPKAPAATAYRTWLETHGNGLMALLRLIRAAKLQIHSLDRVLKLFGEEISEQVYPLPKRRADLELNPDSRPTRVTTKWVAVRWLGFDARFQRMIQNCRPY